jgi:APA family basic amino acid/polyamine antiporter
MPDKNSATIDPSAADRAGAQDQLKRVLGLPTAVLLVAGIMIGSGVFKKIVPMAQSLPSESLLIAAWIAAGVITMFGAFTYAGLSTLTTESGGVYEYLRLIYGDLVSFLFGWSTFTIFGCGALAALAFVFAQSVNTLIPLPLAGWGIKILAVVTIVLLTWFNCRGIRNGGILNNIVTSAKIGGILLLIITALLYSHGGVAPVPGSVVSPLPVSVGATVLSGGGALHPGAGPLPAGALLSGFIGAMLSALWAYDGWANITFITGEIVNPKRNVAYAIFGGVSIAMALYVLLNVGYMRVLPLDRLSQLGPDQIAASEVAGALMGRAGTVTISVLIMACTFSALNGCIISYPRVYFRMAREKVFFRQAGIVHPVTRTPNISLIMSAVWAAALVCSGTFDQITNLIVFASYGYFGLAAFGVVRMKRRGRITARVIGYPVIPWLIIVFCATLMINTILTQFRDSMIGLLLIFCGLPLYLYFKRRWGAAESGGGEGKDAESGG